MTQYGVWCVPPKEVREYYTEGWLHGSFVGQRRAVAKFASKDLARAAVRKLRKNSNAITCWRTRILMVPQ